MDEFIPRHIESIAGRSQPETSRLVAALVRRCWPGGPSDRSEPSAVEWVRRWRPRGGFPAPLSCSCTRGRCRLCN